MTICVSVKVAEGLVLAADSAVMLQGKLQTPQGPQDTILQTFAYANKVSRVKDYPIGVMTWGLGSINNRSLQSLIMEFEYNYPRLADNSSYTVRTVADALLDFVRQRYETAFPTGGVRPALGILIGGYSANQFFADVFSSDLSQAPTLNDVRPPLPAGGPSFGANWFGMTDALTRLFSGYDGPALDELIRRGADQAIVRQWVTDNVPSLPIVFDGMPLQDAIDFAHYAVSLVIGRFRFGFGPELCGGDIDIAVLTPTAFRWAQRKKWAITE